MAGMPGVVDRIVALLRDHFGEVRSTAAEALGGMGPAVAGIAIGAAAFGVPFLVGGGLKIAYDLALFAAFRRVEPPRT